MSQTKSERMLWKNNTEKIFKKWSDHAICYSWMHDRSYKKFNCHYSWFTIPVIILSTITGTANFAHERYEEYASLITMIIGAMNITAAIISTIAQFCKVSEKVEGHRISSIFWDKFGRNIRIELTKDRKDRMKVEEFMKICQEEYNRLIEVSPSIPRDIIRSFKQLAFKNKNMDLNQIEDGDPIACICCDDCCFCDGAVKICCCLPSCSTTPRSPPSQDPDLERGQIELPEICGNFKPTTLHQSDGKNKKEVNKYGLFNINPEDIILDDDDDDGDDNNSKN